MTWKQILFVLTFMVPLIGVARLGDTEAELIERFGQPKSRSNHHVVAQGKSWVLGQALSFRQDDWHVHCYIVDGRCMRISYAKPGDWSEAQIQQVLSSNSQGVRWAEGTPPSQAKSRRAWKRNDGSTAEWTKAGFSLTWNAYEKAKAVLEERAKVEARKIPKI